MTDHELAALSTIAWLIATVAVFILLAGWSTGESWGLMAALVHGVRSWAGSDQAIARATSPSAEALTPFRVPPRPLMVGAATLRGPAAIEPVAGAEIEPVAELVELADRRIER